MVGDKNMDWDVIGAAGEVIGALGVILSLFYLGNQIRRSTNHARAASVRELSDLYPIHQIMVSSPDQIDVQRRGYHDYNGLSKDDQARFHHYLSPLFNQMEAVYRAHEEGLFPDAQYKAWRASLLSLVATPGGRQWWPLAHTLFGDDLVQELETALRDEDITPITEVWSFYKTD